MTTVILLVFAAVCAVFGIRMFYMVISYDVARAEYNKKLKEQQKNKQVSYIIVDDEEDESDVDRQNREYGDYYGDSYYF